MANVNFYLKKTEANGKALIFLRYFVNGKALTYSFSQSIEPKNWNKEKQRVKNNRFTTEDGQYSLNDLLDNLERICKQTYNAELKTGIPQIETIKAALDAFVNQKDNSGKPTLFELIDRFIIGEIKYKGKNKSNNTLRVYKSTRNVLREYEYVKKQKLNFESITLSFYYDFMSFMQNRGSKYKTLIEQLRRKEMEEELKVGRKSKKKREVVDLGVNSMGKYISKLKVFMGEAVELGYTNNKAFENKKFVAPKEETDAIYLSEKDIDQLYRHDFSKNRRLERVKDLFVFGCYVGLRFDDFSKIHRSNIITIKNDDNEDEYFLKVQTKKTGELVYIPCHHFVLEIFEKYGENANKLPPSISNQNFNDYIKEACKEAELTDAGRLLEEAESETWELVSSHTARRSFATNYYLDGFPTIDLMKITGHKTEKAFLGYIKVGKLDTAKRLNEHMKKRWLEKQQKVALRVA